MTSIRNDRSSSSAPTSSTSTSRTQAPAAAPPPDDLEGVEDIDRLNGQTKTAVDADVQCAAPTRTSFNPAHQLIAKPVRPNDVAGVTGLATSAIASLKPGEKASIGAKGSAAVEVAVGGEIGMEVSRREDGKYEVKLEQSGFLGVGGKVSGGGPGNGATLSVAGGFKAAASVSFVVDTPAEAADIIAAAAVGAAAAQVLPVPTTAAAAGAAMAYDTSHISEVGIAAGFAIEAEVELELFSTLQAAAAGEMMAGFVYAAPDKAYLELKVAVEGGGGLGMSFGHEATAVLGGVEGAGEVTVRIPLGTIGSAEELTDPARQKALLSGLEKKAPEGTTMSFEGTLEAGAGLAGVGVEITKEIDGNRLDKLFAPGGWEVRASAQLGGKLAGKLGPASAEVAAVRTATLYEASATSPEAALTDVKAHAREIEQAAKRGK